MPRVSVIIPTYNRAEMIVECIRSVLSQTYTNFEIIVVDDGSIDNTRKVISRLYDSRIRYIYQQNRGISAARNVGIENSRGEYIAFLDSDDQWLPQKLEYQVKCLDSSPEIGLVYTDLYIYDLATDKLVDQSLKGRKFQPPRGKAFKQLVKIPYSPYPSTVMLRKQAFDKAGSFDESMEMVEDSELIFRIARYFDFEVINIPLVKYRKHANQISKQSDYLRWKIIFWNNIAKLPTLDSKTQRIVGRRLARIRCEYGFILMRQGKLHDGFCVLLSSLKANPIIFSITVITIFSCHLFHRLSSLLVRS